MIFRGITGTGISAYCLLFQLAILAIKECRSLRSVIIRVPEVVKSGDSVTLSCDYDLEQAPLYTIKWYQGEEEFYRFVPKESPPSKAFSVPFINVDVSKSGPTTVTLRGVRRELTGNYKCEVSADAPLFHTEIKVAHMTVAELPNGGVDLSVKPAKAEIGKMVTADCTSPGSDPAANVTWYINSEKVTQQTRNVQLYPTRIEMDAALGLYSAKSQLKITVSKNHFGSNNKMAIRCEANIFSLWKRTADVLVQNDTPQPAPVLVPTSSQSHTGNNPRLRGSSNRISAYSPKILLLLGVILLQS